MKMYKNVNFNTNSSFYNVVTKNGRLYRKCVEKKKKSFFLSNLPLKHYIFFFIQDINTKNGEKKDNFSRNNLDIHNHRTFLDILSQSYRVDLSYQKKC